MTFYWVFSSIVLIYLPKLSTGYSLDILHGAHFCLLSGKPPVVLSANSSGFPSLNLPKILYGDPSKISCEISTGVFLRNLCQKSCISSFCKSLRSFF